MDKSPFIFEPGIWLGQGTIKLNFSDEELPFHTRWSVEKKDKDGKIRVIQEVQISGLSESVDNHFVFSSVAGGAFSIELYNDSVGTVLGEGLRKNNKVSWEFRSEDLEGFEHFEVLSDGTYAHHSEYCTKDDYRSQIKGKIWRVE